MKQRVENIEKSKFWQKHIESCEESGLSGVEYCREHGLSMGRFSCWKSRLRARSTEIAKRPVGFVELSAPLPLPLPLAPQCVAGQSKIKLRISEFELGSLAELRAFFMSGV